MMFNFGLSISKVCAALVLSALVIPARAKSGGQDGTGGAGVRRGSVYMTFGTAGVWVEPAPIESGDPRLPELNALVDRVFNDQSFPAWLRDKMFEAINPAVVRKYYLVESSRFTPETRRRLMDEYLKVTGATSREIELFAVTDIKNKATYLLPEFFKLAKTSERMAILYHEAYWLMRPDATYAEVIHAEMGMQKWLEGERTASNFSALTRGLSDGGFLQEVLLKVAFDAVNGSLYGVRIDEIEGRIDLDGSLFAGGVLLDCLNKAELDADKGKVCRSAYVNHMLWLKRTYWNSATIQFLVDQLLERRELSSSTWGASPGRSRTYKLRLLAEAFNAQIGIDQTGARRGMANEEYCFSYYKDSGLRFYERKCVRGEQY